MTKRRMDKRWLVMIKMYHKQWLAVAVFAGLTALLFDPDWSSGVERSGVVEDPCASPVGLKTLNDCVVVVRLPDGRRVDVAHGSSSTTYSKGQVITLIEGHSLIFRRASYVVKEVMP